jgi:uncharacterized protein YecT (DUF1311 family)
MKNYKILILSLFAILCFSGHSLAQEKHWNQIDTDDLTQVEIKDKYRALLEHNKAELNKTVSECLEVINQDDDIMRKEIKEEMVMAFLKSQDAWDKLIELDKQVVKYEYYCGSGTEIFTLKYQIGKTFERIKDLKKRFCLN